MAGRPKSEERELAILLGNPTYEGSTHERCGTRERYVKGGGCVHCARLVQADQREALKAQRALEEQQRAEDNDPNEEGRPHYVEPEPGSEAAFIEAIDALM